MVRGALHSLLLLSVSGCACSVQAPDSELLMQASLEKQADSEAAAITYIIEACQFQINTPDPSTFEVHGHTGYYYADYPYADRGSFKTVCFDVSESSKITDWLGAKKIDEGWKKYSSAGGLNEPFLDFWPEENAEVIQLDGSNWTGTAIATDEITGDESSRSRWLNFCLMHDSQVLCGAANVMALGLPGTNVQDNVVAVLKSVEFVDVPAPDN